MAIKGSSYLSPLANEQRKRIMEEEKREVYSVSQASGEEQKKDFNGLYQSSPAVLYCNNGQIIPLLKGDYLRAWKTGLVSIAPQTSLIFNQTEGQFFIAYCPEQSMQAQKEEKSVNIQLFLKNKKNPLSFIKISFSSQHDRRELFSENEDSKECLALKDFFIKECPEAKAEFFRGDKESQAHFSFPLAGNRETLEKTVRYFLQTPMFSFPFFGLQSEREQTVSIVSRCEEALELFEREGKLTASLQKKLLAALATLVKFEPSTIVAQKVYPKEQMLLIERLFNNKNFFSFDQNSLGAMTCLGLGAANIALGYCDRGASKDYVLKIRHKELLGLLFNRPLDQSPQNHQDPNNPERCVRIYNQLNEQAIKEKKISRALLMPVKILGNTVNLWRSDWLKKTRCSDAKKDKDLVWQSENWKEKTGRVVLDATVEDNVLPIEGQAQDNNSGRAYVCIDPALAAQIEVRSREPSECSKSLLKVCKGPTNPDLERFFPLFFSFAKAQLKKASEGPTALVR